MSRVIYVTQDVNIHGGIEEVTRLFMRHFPRFHYHFAISGRPAEWQYRLHYLFAYIRFFVKMITYQPSAVHVNMGAARDFVRNIPYVLMPKLFGVPVILQPHMEVDWGFRTFPKLLARMVTWVVMKADLYVFLAPTHERAFREFRPRARTAVIPNAIPEAFFEQAPLPYEQRKNKVVYLGRFHTQKGTDLLLEVAKRHIEENPEVVYELHGYGPVKGKSTERLIIGTWIGLNEKIRLIREAMVMVVPSREEAFGLIIAEAMACGTPVVATRVGGIPDVMADGVHGRLVESEDVAGIVGALEMMMKDTGAWRRYSLADIAEAGNFRGTEVFRSWEQVYRRIAAIARVAPRKVSAAKRAGQVT